jgi:peptidoglycan hydrolase CwlO-like protein
MHLRIDWHIHVHFDDPISSNIEKEIHHMSQQLDDLSAQVQATTDLEASAVTMIQGLASQISALKDDPAKLQALADSLKSGASALAAAIAANTPAAPDATPPADASSPPATPGS